MTTLFHFAALVNAENFGIGILPAAATMPRGFTAIGGAYIPSDAESVWATLDAERLESDQADAAMEWLASEAAAYDAMSLGFLPSDLAA